MMMIIFRLAPYSPRPRPARPRRVMQHFRVMKTLAEVVVPAHGFVAGAKGLITTNNQAGIRSQFWSFVKQIIRGCFWASMIAAGMLVYTAFTAKWKEKGFPVIPISAMIAAEQAMGGGSVPGRPPGTVIPLGGGGSAQGQNQQRPREERRQTSLLDLDEYEG